jgi:hypothetical protein
VPRLLRPLKSYHHQRSNHRRGWTIPASLLSVLFLAHRQRTAHGAGGNEVDDAGLCAEAAAGRG